MKRFLRKFALTLIVLAMAVTVTAITGAQSPFSLFGIRGTQPATASLASVAPAAESKDGEDDSAKLAAYARMRELQGIIAALKAKAESDPDNAAIADQLAAARAEYKEISDSLGGDELPNEAVRGGSRNKIEPRPNVVSVPAGCSSSTATFTNNQSASINVLFNVVSTIEVNGADPYLWDLDLQTFITHTANADIDMTLISPAGTEVTITTDNGGTLDNVFNGTVWDDQAAMPVTDFVYSNNVVAPALQPEEALTAFIGENPNGTWTLVINDDSALNNGTLHSWSLTVTSLPAAPIESTVTAVNPTDQSITNNNTITSTIEINGAGTFLREVVLVTDIVHTFNDDLDITLTSPSGRTVVITTDNGGGNDNVFAGTVWDDDAGSANPSGPVTDATFSNNVTATPLVPEGALAAFMGEDPNGTWTLSITDDASGDTGTLREWRLILTTAECGQDLCAGITQTFSKLEPAEVANNLPTVVQTIEVSNAGPYLIDLNLQTFLTHLNSEDIDMTLTSPAGTVVTITTDNGGLEANAFNGTIWDDQADLNGQVPYDFNNQLVTDRLYLLNSPAQRLVPEEAFGAFIGEDPNGTWTLTVHDDTFNFLTGQLNSWSLEITTLPAPPIETTTTFESTTTSSFNVLNPVRSHILVTGAGTKIGRVRVITDIEHTANDDLDITLTSPSGRIVTLTTDNGGNANNGFKGTVWDDKAGAVNPPGPVTDTDFQNNVAEATLVAEEALAAFNGENPNGLWTLTIIDDGIFDNGTLNGWSLEITTIECVEPCEVVCPQDIVVSNDQGQCGATVEYTLETTGACDDIVASPPSGSVFPVGTTTVTVTLDEETLCSFTVTVNDAEAPVISCPAPIVTANDMDQCSVVVNFTVSATDNCDPSVTVMATPPSGSTFPVGVTTVTVTATDASGNVGNCSFTVTVNDTQPPVIACPSLNVVAVSGGAGCAIVDFDMPGASDNCPGVTVTANPPPGSCFPVGTTTIIFTATDASGNTATTAACPPGSGITITVYDFCIEDTSNPGKVVLVNSQTGDYLFCCTGQQVAGKGTVTRKGNSYTLLHNAPDRMVQIKFDTSTKQGQASLNMPINTPVCVIRDTNITNNSCNCGTPPEAIGQVGAP